MDFIIKVAYDCNLNCSYCYEKENNKKRQSFSLDEIEIIFHKIYEYYSINNPKERLNFCWHGGEPMLMGIEFYRNIMRLQQKIFGGRIDWHNSMQTNLALLDDEALGFLKNNKNTFCVGVSFDFYGDERIMKNGVSSAEIVFNNMQKLYEIYGCLGILTVLTRSNMKYLSGISDFIAQNNVTISFHPEFKPSFIKGDAFKNHAFISEEEYCGSLSLLIDKWWHNKNALGVIRNVIAIMKAILNNLNYVQSKHCNEKQVFLKPGGDVYPCDHINSMLCGNIFRDSLENILSSPCRLRVTSRYKIIQKKLCKGCAVVNYCVGGCGYGKISNHENVCDKDPFCRANYFIINKIINILNSEGAINKNKQITGKGIKLLGLIENFEKNGVFKRSQISQSQGRGRH